MDRFWQRFWEASCVLFKRSSLLFLHYYCLKMLFCRIFAFATGSSFEEMALQWWREKCVELYNDWQLYYTAGTFFVVTGSYWVLGSFFMILDQTGWLSRYKIRPGINQPPDARELGKVVCTVLFNQIIIVLPYTTMSYYAMQIRAGLMSQERLCEVLSFERMALELVFDDIIFDITLYSTHVLLHTKWLYRFIHKQHHEWKSPVAITAGYAHPLEFLLSDAIPFSMGPFLVSAHPVSHWFWLYHVTWYALYAHSNYRLPGFDEFSDFHEFHHITFNQNYGNCGFMDRFFGTDSLYNKLKIFRK